MLIRYVPLALVAVLGCAASLILTIQFCVGYVGYGAPLAIGIGVLWELAKWVFLPIGVRTADTAPGMLMLTLFLALTVGSMAASVAYLDDTGRRHVDTAAGTKILDEEIGILVKSMGDDVRLGYRSRAAKTAERISELRGQRGEAVTAIKQIATSVQWGLAAVIELVAIAAIWSLSMKTRTVSAVSGVYRPSQPVSTAATVETSRDDTCATEITRGNISPTVRSVRDALGIGQRQAAETLHRLAERGVIRRDGRGYVSTA